MASPRRFPVFVIVLFLVTLSHVVVVSADYKAKMQPMIDKICRSLEPGDYGFCNQLFIDNIVDLPKTMEGLGQVAQLAAFDNSSRMQLSISQMVEEAKPGSPEMIPLDTCRKVYLFVRAQFRAGVDKYYEGQYADALKAERESPRTQALCSSTFRVPGYPQNPLIEWKHQMRILTAMAIATLRELIG